MPSYVVLIEWDPEGGGVSAYCPDLPGCVAAAQTEEELLPLMAEAMAFHLEGLAEGGEPAPSRTVRAVEIVAAAPSRQPA